jgi:hypothetical protein
MALLPANEEWSLGSQVLFRGAKLPRGLRVQTLVLDGCSELTELPEDLCTENLCIQHCPKLRTLDRLPPGVKGLWIEHAPELVGLPETVNLESAFHLSACPRLQRLPEVIKARFVKISHCPGLQMIVGKIRCERIEFASLFHLAELDLDLESSGDLDVTLPSLQTLRIRGVLGARLRIACPVLENAYLDLSVKEFALIENCRSLESLDGSIRVKGNLAIRRNPRLMSLPTGNVGGRLGLEDLPAIRSLDPNLLASSRSLRIFRCAVLAGLPERVRLGSSMELLDLPELDHWPESLEVSTLTVLGCPQLAPPHAGVTVRGAFRRSDAAAREEVRQALEADVGLPDARVQSLRGAIRTLRMAGVSYKDRWRLLLAEGHPEEDLLTALLGEGSELNQALERCVAPTKGTDGEIKAAIACTRVGIHPATLALVTRNPIRARWMAELFSDSLDLMSGWRGDGGLRLEGPLAWDLPESLVVPGRLRVHGVAGPAMWPKRMRVLGGILLKSTNVQAPPSEQNLSEAVKLDK